MYLKVDKATKKYGAFTALDGVSIELEKGEFVCLLGPSGCGKTTLLRIIAGLTGIDAGSLLLEGQDISKVPARQRDFGIVFQSYSLFPNMTVAENIGYGLKIRGVSEATIASRVTDLLEMVHLPNVGQKYPGQLSGGQQQRIALARAIAVDPRVLLLDEPLSALDAKVRGSLRDEIKQVQRSLGIPTLMVTHDQEEAIALADKIICMNHGVVVQAGTPEELYHKPKTRFVADFMGAGNLIEPCRVQDVMPELLADMPTTGNGRYFASLRPEKISVKSDQLGTSTIRSISFLGNLTRLKLESPLGDLVVETHGESELTEGQAVALEIAPSSVAWVADDMEGEAV